jgi:hypothetical protein
MQPLRKQCRKLANVGLHVKAEIVLAVAVHISIIP